MSYQYYCMVQNVGGLPRDSQRLSGFHTPCLRKICRIYWPQKITNKELYQGTGQRDIRTVIKQRRWRWLGYVVRKAWDSITWTALRWTLDSGRRKRGCPRETWRRTIEAEMKTTGKTWKELETQPRIGSNGNLWFQPYVSLRRKEDHSFLPPPPPTAGADYIMSACTQSRIRLIDWKKVCMTSAKLHVFWPASLWHQVTKACVVRKACFVTQQWQMAMSCGKKTNLPCNLATVLAMMTLRSVVRK